MKLILTTSLFCIIISFTNAQTTQKERKIVQVLTPQTIYLNGGARATFGGKSRVLFNIDLPANTVEWYYSYSTARGENPSTTIELFAQLTRLFDPSGMTAISTNAIFTPSGAGVCDIYLMDRTNAGKFYEKVDQWGGTYSYWLSGSRENGKNGTVQIKDNVKGTVYLGFKNPSMTEGVSIIFEVAAIVEETKIIEKTATEQKADMYGKMGWNAYERGEYDKCLELSKKAVEINPDLGWVHNNIGLVMLIKGDYITAIDSYSLAITLFKKSADPYREFEAAIQDLNNLIAKLGKLEGGEDILQMLKSEQRN